MADDDDLTTYPALRDALRAARGEAQEGGGTVYVCRAARVGCSGQRPSCGDCYAIGPRDRRSLDDHLRAYLGGDA